MKYILMLDTPFWMLVSACLTAWGFSWKRRAKALNAPWLLLPRKERRAQARLETAEYNEDRQRAQYERDLGVVHGHVNVDPIKKENI